MPCLTPGPIGGRSDKSTRSGLDLEFSTGCPQLPSKGFVQSQAHPRQTPATDTHSPTAPQSTCAQPVVTCLESMQTTCAQPLGCRRQSPLRGPAQPPGPRCRQHRANGYPHVYQHHRPPSLHDLYRVKRPSAPGCAHADTHLYYNSKDLFVVLSIYPRSNPTPGGWRARGVSSWAW